MLTTTSPLCQVQQPLMDIYGLICTSYRCCIYIQALVGDDRPCAYVQSVIVAQKATNEKSLSLSPLPCDGICRYIFDSSTTWDSSTTYLKFDPTGVRTHDLQIITVHFMSLKCLL